MYTTSNSMFNLDACKTLFSLINFMTIKHLVCATAVRKVNTYL